MISRIQRIERQNRVCGADAHTDIIEIDRPARSLGQIMDQLLVLLEERQSQVRTPANKVRK